jgi:hypothetical protein
MSTRIETIIRKVRSKLADKDGDRWSDQDLLDLLDQGHKDYAHHARLLRGETVLPLVIGQAVYTLPDDIFIVLRAEYNFSNLHITTYDNMDEQNRKQILTRNELNNESDYTRVNSDFGLDRIDLTWQSDTGQDPEAIIFDKSNMNECRIYPIPEENDDDVQYTFENESGVDLPFVGAELYGLVTAIDNYTFDQVEGVVTDLYEV